jgi:hypothetical protein
VKLTDAMFSSDGRRIITHDCNRECRIWQLPEDVRPIDDLTTLSLLLSGRTETRFGQLTSPASESLETIWKRLRSKYPATFDTSTEEIERWHEFEAEECRAHKQWLAEAFHLKRLLTLRPTDHSISIKIDAVNEHLAKGK